jgi:hypothetical protein
MILAIVVFGSDVAQRQVCAPIGGYHLGTSTEFVLDDDVNDPDTRVDSVAVIFSGIFRFVLGEVKNKDGYDLMTRPVVMAMRGLKPIIYVDEKADTIANFEQGDRSAPSYVGRTMGPAAS